MTLLVTILIVLVLLGLAIYANQQLKLLSEPVKSAIAVVLVMIAIVFIIQRAGWLK